MSRPCWAVLGIAPTAAKTEIKAAYRKLAFELHPDRDHTPGAEDRFKELVAAYEEALGKRVEAPRAYEPARQERTQPRQEPRRETYYGAGFRMNREERPRERDPVPDYNWRDHVIPGTFTGGGGGGF